jgi:four helix bundle protein
MTPKDMQDRTKAFALAVTKYVQTLPHDPVTRVFSFQLLKSGTSVGANYRAASRAQSKAAFQAKMAIVEEEADECGYWLELLVAAGISPAESVKGLAREADALTAIAVSSIKTARGGKSR